MSKAYNQKVVLLAGGGTGGPTAPLLAIAEKLFTRDDVRLVFVGTKNGPERSMAGSMGVEFDSLPVAKLRRYFSLRNFFDVLVLLPASFIKSLWLINKYGADIVVGAGSFVSVPLVWAASLSRKKILIHQQDLIPTLSNKLTAPFADIVTLTFPEQKENFKNGVVTGNPVRESTVVYSKDEASRAFDLDPDKPTVLVFGGGTGAIKLNEMIENIVPRLAEEGVQILHITGKNSTKSADFLRHITAGYVRREFLPEGLGQAYAACDVIVCRAGLSTISELSFVAKPAIIIPMPDSHQEINADFVLKKDAAIILDQNKISTTDLYEEIFTLINNEDKKNKLKNNISQLMPHSAASTIAQHVYNLI